MSQEKPAPIYRCTRCDEVLDPEKMVWLELSFETGRFGVAGSVPEAESQGCFVFGSACAKRVLKNKGECDYKSSRTHARRR